MHLRLPVVTLGPGRIQRYGRIGIFVRVVVLLLFQESQRPIAVQDRIVRTELDGVRVVQDCLGKVPRLDTLVTFLFQLVRRQVQIAFASFFLRLWTTAAALAGRVILATILSIKNITTQTLVRLSYDR